MYKFSSVSSSLNSHRKRMLSDMILNIISNAIPVFVLQFLVQPYIAKALGADENGRYLALMSLLHCAVMITGTTLHTTRLLRERDYKENAIIGDFNLFLLISAVVNLCIICVGSLILNCSPLDIVFIALLSVIWMIKDYVIVEYRLKLTYKRILYNNLLLCLGYVLGIVLYQLIPKWYVIILAGYLLSFTHIFFTTNLLKEPIRQTALLKGSLKVLSILVLTECMAVFVMNYDRFVILALLSGSAVSIYYSATIMGKMMSMLSAPVSNVILSYLVDKKELSKRAYHIVWGISISSGFVLYVFCVIVSPWILMLLYPDWASESIKLIYITCGIALFDYIRSIIKPFILRFCSIHFQYILKGIQTVLYGVFGFLSLKFFSLKGFAICNMSIGVLLCIMMFVVGETQLNKPKGSNIPLSS